MKFKEAVRWVIVCPHGMYTGQWLRKVDAIAQHVSEMAPAGDPPISPYTFGSRGLSPEQKRAWRKRQKAGDQVRPAVIRYCLR